MSARVGVDQGGDFERVLQAYDPSGRLTYERIQDRLNRGGKAVGADADHWLRRIERTYDPATGRMIRQTVWRFAQVPLGENGLKSTWLAVNVRAGLAAGSPKVSAEP